MTVPGPNNLCFKIVRGVICGWIVLLVLALYPYTEDPATPIKTLLSAMAAVIATSIWTVGMISRRAPYRPAHPSVYLLAGFLAFQTTLALCSSTPQRSFYAVAPWLVYGTMAFLVFQAFPHTRHVRVLMRVIVASVTVSSVYGMIQYLGLDPFPWAVRSVEEFRGLPATYGHPNFAGHALVVALILCAGLAVDGFRRGTPYRTLTLCAIAGIVLVTHLHLTHMRGAVVALCVAGLAAAVAALLWRMGTVATRAWYGALLTASAVLLGCGALAWYFASSVPLESSLQLRLHSMAGAASMFLDHGVFGVAPGNYGFQNIPYWSDFEALWYGLMAKRNHHVHNEWLEIAVESGVLGIFLFLLLCTQRLATVATRAGKVTPLTTALGVAFLAMLVDGIFGFNLHVPVSGAFFFLLVLTAPDDTEWGEMPGRVIRGIAPLLVILMGFCATLMGWNFAGERAYQQGQGALAWARSNPVTVESASLPETAHRLFLDAQQWKVWDYRAPMALGDLALQSGHGEDAVAAYERALRNHPFLPRLQLQLARAYLVVATTSTATTTSTTRAADLDVAEDLVTDVLERCPEIGEAHALMGWVYWARLPELNAAALEEARHEMVTAFEGARRHGVTGDGQLEFAMGQGYVALGQRPEAMGALFRAIAITPSSEIYWATATQIADEEKDLWHQRFRQLLLHHVATNEHLSLAMRGSLARQVVDNTVDPLTRKIAAASLQRALDGHPESLTLWCAWLRTVPDNATEQALTDALARHAEGAPVHQSIRRLSAALAAPNNIEALAQLVDTVAWPPATEAPVDQMRDIRVLANAVPPLAAPRGEQAFQLGRLYFYGGDWVRAERELRLAATQLPALQLGAVNYYLSGTLAHRGLHKPALALARDALKSDPTSILYQWNFALRLAESGETAAARFQLGALLRQTSQQPEYHEAISAALQSITAASGETRP